ncbi:kinesin-like protein KIN-7F isoform X2 [Amborella trichopoda]|uniref:Kinesin-like protein n=1 Tax=Amborella trichopoda TaxID=13333 RepID=U5D1M3_AMBTC|nr:kinesin-like protein KIN-7F isoform X2 [Amborella trichopoda]ERN16334.1 hypothetical protein AMTR_s00182p00038530 [Amborella trichopoda]|eukprot:XP_006854867.1 kinesin-like protein KIN-7F isoform X2 [Amborella trichopoda]
MGEIGVGEEDFKWEKRGDAGGERILVSIRLRPLNAKEIARNDTTDWECINDTTIIFRNSVPERSMAPVAYTFDRVFRSDCSTRQVYEDAAKQVALSAVSGINSTIFAYGQTSSGKTYTMIGITEYTVSDIYDYIQRHEERAFVLKFSAIEIYNEAVRDLLSPDSTPLRLLDDPERGTIVEKLTEETLNDWDHLCKLLSICEAQRQIGETSLNEMSSRSHQILRLTIESSAREFLGKENSSTLVASVNFVDLAGSERASQALSGGTRLKEGCHINRSLLTLGTVIRKLSKNRNGHIPYRDSKLTRILQPSLGGNSRTAIICTMSPAHSHLEQSRNTLFFANCAKEVATSAQVNVVMSDKALVKHLQNELARLENELRTPGRPSLTTNYSEALLREKDNLIKKMEKEIRELKQQRNLAQSRLEDLLRVIGNDCASRIWDELSTPPMSNALCEDELSMKESSGADASLNYGFKRFHRPRLSETRDDCGYDEPDLDPPEMVNDCVHYPVSSPKFSESEPYKIQETEDNESDALCKEVQCVPMKETSREGEGLELAVIEENEELQTLEVCENGYATDQEQIYLPEEREIRDIEETDQDANATLTDQQLQTVQRSIQSLARPYLEEPSPWPLNAILSGSRSLTLTRSRSCRAQLMSGPNSLWPWDKEQNENTPPSRFETVFPGRPASIGMRLHSLNFGAESENISRGDSQVSERSSSVDVQKAQNMFKSAAEENITSIRSFVVELKERMAKLQHPKQPIGGKTPDATDDEEAETQKNMQDAFTEASPEHTQSLSNWPLEFERQRREIIELWHTCHVSLFHRTYFFLLFRGDPADSIYIEVELRRLSFLKNKFADRNPGILMLEDGHSMTLAASIRGLRRERESFSRQMKRRLTSQERENLYRKWGIGLETKQRRLQLAQQLWTNPQDMDHVQESATVVARVLGFSESGQALKEMFELSFTPQRLSRRSRSLLFRS